jgi:hypothetical protein
MYSVSYKQLNGEGSLIDNLQDFIIKKNTKSINGFTVAKLHTIDNDIVDVIIRPYNARQIAIDKFKENLNLLTIGYNLFIYKGKKYMISEYRNHMALEIKMKKYKADIDFFSDICIQEIRKIFAFQWLLRVTNISESTVILKHYLDGPDFYFLTPYSYNEVYNIFDVEDKNMRFVFPQTILKKWFAGNIKNLYKSLRDLTEGFSVKDLCNKFETILLKFSPQDLKWKDILRCQLEVLDIELQSLSAEKQCL